MAQSGITLALFRIGKQIRDRCAPARSHSFLQTCFVEVVMDVRLSTADYGKNYDRLARIKSRYDPTNLFRANMNIRPLAYA